VGLFGGSKKSAPMRQGPSVVRGGPGAVYVCEEETTHTPKGYGATTTHTNMVAGVTLNFQTAEDWLCGHGLNSGSYRSTRRVHTLQPWP